MKRFSELIVAHYPERSIGIVNRGVGGNRISDLRLRWRDDVLCMKPNWLSISIGINDVHSHLFGPEPRTNPEEFRRIYSNLLETLEGGLRRRTVLLDPFYIHRKSLECSRENMVMESLPGFIEVVHAMQVKYETRLIPTHDLFQNHLRYREPHEFCLEPVYPNEMGHLIIVEELVAALSD